MVFHIKLALALLLPFFFVWYEGALAVTMILCSQLSCLFFERKRKGHQEALQTNRDQVNARLLDVIKNGTVIKIMGTAKVEQDALIKLENHGDQARTQDARLKFMGDLTRLCLTFSIPILIIFLEWLFLQRADNPLDKVNDRFSVLVTIILMGEGHSALISLSYIYERELGTQKALEAVEDFLSGNNKRGKELTTTASDASTEGSMDIAEKGDAFQAACGEGFLRDTTSKSAIALNSVVSLSHIQVERNQFFALIRKGL